MGYLEQILSGAQQRGGLTDNEFNSIFQQFMPQQPTQPNMGFPQQQAMQQAPQMIPLAKQDNSMGMYGKEMASLGSSVKKKFKSTPEEEAIKVAEEEARKAKLLESLGMGGISKQMNGLFDF